MHVMRVMPKQVIDNNSEHYGDEENYLGVAESIELARQPLTVTSDIDPTPIKPAPIRYAVPKTVERESDQPEPLTKQRYRIDLAAQQAECELNYARLTRLLVNLSTQDEWRFEIGGHPMTTYFTATIVDRAPYTTTVQLIQKKDQQQTAEEKNSTHNKQSIGDVLQSSSITVCLYHDANMAEVVAWKNHKRLRARYEYPNKAMYHQDEKAQLNQFLSEWLTNCQKNGRVIMDIPTSF